MKKYKVTFYITIEDKKYGHTHPECELEFKAKSFKEAEKIIRDGHIQIQEQEGKWKCIVKDLKNI